jgi:AraC family transcriptional regulator
MFSRIEYLSPKNLVGLHTKMSLSDNKTAVLWQKFMVRRKEIIGSLSNDLFSMQVYDKTKDFKKFDQNTVFEKWAAIEVNVSNQAPDGFEDYSLHGGMYAVFIYKGLPDNFHHAFNYIFNIWLPNSDFVLDDREHFEILGEKYKQNDPSSEEEVWIPIKIRNG